MTMRITGMYSGLDTESIIQELVKVKSTKVENLKKDKTRYEWKQEAWKSLNSKIKSFYSSSLGNLRFSSSYKKRTTTVSNSSAVSVITGESAMSSVQTLSIKSLAKSGYMTGQSLKSGSDEEITSSTLLSDLRLTKAADGSEASGLAEINGSGSITVSVGDKVTNIEINAESTIESVVSGLKGAGIDANFDQKNGRIYLSSGKSGYTDDFAITANNAIGFTALSVLGINESLGTSSDTKENANAKTLNTYNQFASYASLLAGITVTTTSVPKLDENDEPVLDEDNNPVMEEVTTVSGTDDLLSDVNSDIYKAIKAEMKTEDDYDDAIVRLKEKADFAASVVSADSTYTSAMYSNDAVRIAGQDARIILNDVEYTSNSNNIEVNGLTFTCLSLADNVTVTTQDDTDGVYDMIKNFFKEYNSLINEIDKLYNADSADKYDPLTDDEKDEMSDSEIEKWETKIKDAVLRRDDTLGTIQSSLRDVMMGGYTVNGETMYLSNFGIETLSYFLAEDNQHNAYHISGDADDAAVSSEADKLKSAIANDPDTVVGFFVELSRTLYSKMSELSSGTDYRSSGSFYDDKQYKTNVTNYESKIQDAEDALADYEDKYYKKFSNMEVALSKLESSTNSLTSMLGS